MTANLCVLVGNGLSTAYNPDLAIPALTAELVEAFRGLGGDEAAGALQELPNTLSGTGREDFEALLSPFEFGAQAMTYLTALAPLAPDPQSNIAQAMERVQGFLRRTHQLGLGLALEAIERRARVHHGAHFQQTVGAFASAVAQRQFLPLRVFTPNYDNLLHSAFLDMNISLSDLAHGGEFKDFRFAGTAVRAWRIRFTASELMDTSVILVNVHGSLNWLTQPQTGDVWKFRIDDLRFLGDSAEGYWRLLADGRVHPLPSVVLTDRKQEVVKQWPFSLAYELMERSFARCARWVIAGFSFGDEAINSSLRRAIAVAGTRPLCLVLGYGDEGQILDRVKRALGDRPRFVVDGSGLPAALGGPKWQAWAQATP